MVKKINNAYPKIENTIVESLESTNIIKAPERISEIVSPDIKYVSLFDTDESSNFGKVIDDLIDGEVRLKDNDYDRTFTQALSIEDFSGLSLNGFDKKVEKFNEYVLKHLNSEKYNNKIYQHWGVREGDFYTTDDVETETVVKFINENIDLSDSLLDNYLNANITDKKQHWNESIAELIQLYQDLLSNDETEIDSTNITIEDIKRADAGLSFNESPWVKPWFNVDNKSYSTVRNNDKIERVLNDSVFAQFTKKQKPNTEKIYNYLRLIMPEYERSVEIEDLDRNFWVIGQVLTGLCSYLFDENSPIDNIFDRLFDEIAQLWENVFHLWLAAQDETKQSYKNIQPIFIPVSPYNLNPYVKSDGFCTFVSMDNKEGEDGVVKNISDTSDLFWSTDGFLTPKEIVKYFKSHRTSYGAWQKIILKQYFELYYDYLKAMYNGNAIVVIPEFRLNNYKHNYYNQAAYFGAIIYDESLPTELKEQFITFKEPVIVDLLSSDSYDLDVDERSGILNHAILYLGKKQLDLNLLGIKENEMTYDFEYPQEDSGSRDFIVLVRPSCSIELEKNNDIYSLKSMELKFTDVAAEIAGLNNNERIVLTYNEETGEAISHTNSIEVNFTYETNALPLGAAAPLLQSINKTVGFYRGELISWYLGRSGDKSTTDKFDATVKIVWDYNKGTDIPFITDILTITLRQERRDGTFINQTSIQTNPFDKKDEFVFSNLDVFDTTDEQYVYKIIVDTLDRWDTIIDYDTVDSSQPVSTVTNIYVGDISGRASLVRYPLIPYNILKKLDSTAISGTSPHYQITGKYEIEKDEFDTNKTFGVTSYNNDYLDTSYMVGQGLTSQLIQKNRLTYFNTIQRKHNREKDQIFYNYPNIIIPEVYEVESEDLYSGTVEDEQRLTCFFGKDIQTPPYSNGDFLFFYPTVAQDEGLIKTKLKGFMSPRIAFFNRDSELFGHFYNANLCLNWKTYSEDNVTNFKKPIWNYETEVYRKNNETSFEEDNWCVRMTIMAGYYLTDNAIIQDNGVANITEDNHYSSLNPWAYTDIYSFLFCTGDIADFDGAEDGNGNPIYCYGMELERAVNFDNQLHYYTSNNPTRFVFNSATNIPHWSGTSTAVGGAALYQRVHKAIMQNYTLCTPLPLEVNAVRTQFYKYPRTGINITGQERDYCPDI